MRHPSVETLHRMLDKAHAEGVRILHTAQLPERPGIRGAQVSSSRPGEPPYTVLLYAAGFVGCDCPGYEQHGYCKHWALVLDRAGLLPELPEAAAAPGETPAAAVPAEAQPDPWAPAPVSARELITSTVTAAMNPADRKAAAAADLARRQSAVVPGGAADLLLRGAAEATQRRRRTRTLAAAS